MATKADDVNNRTHEPSLRELTADLDGPKELLLAKIDNNAQVMNERDRRYEDRFNAMDEKTTLALASSEKAVTKAESATEKRFDSVNEFRNTLKDQASSLMPRGEVEAKYKAYDTQIDEMKKELSAFRIAHQTVAQQSDITSLRVELMKEISGLRESRSEGTGEKSVTASLQTQRNWGVGIIVAIFFGGASLLLSAISIALSMRK